MSLSIPVILYTPLGEFSGMLKAICSCDFAFPKHASSAFPVSTCVNVYSVEYSLFPFCWIVTRDFMVMLLLSVTSSCSFNENFSILESAAPPSSISCIQSIFTTQLGATVTDITFFPFFNFSSGISNTLVFHVLFVPDR